MKRNDQTCEFAKVTLKKLIRSYVSDSDDDDEGGGHSAETPLRAGPSHDEGDLARDAARAHHHQGGNGR